MQTGLENVAIRSNRVFRWPRTVVWFGRAEWFRFQFGQIAPRSKLSRNAYGKE